MGSKPNSIKLGTQHTLDMLGPLFIVMVFFGSLVNNIVYFEVFKNPKIQC